MTFINNPTITDVTQISVNMADIESLGMVIAVALMGLLIPLEFLRQNLKVMEGQSTYSGTFVRILIVCLGLILYKTLFNFMVGIGVVVENAILSLPQWADFLTELGKFYLSYKPSLFSSLVPLLFAWLASFLALVIKAVIYWVRYALLSVLYFVGPISFVFYIFEPTRHALGSWFKNVLQLSLWTVVLRILVRVMLALQVKTFIAQANMEADVVTIIGINVTFIVMIIASPLFTAEFISDHTIGPLAVIASGFFAAPGAILAKTIPGAAGLKAVKAAGVGLGYLRGRSTITNTETWRKLFPSKNGAGGANARSRSSGPSPG